MKRRKPLHCRKGPLVAIFLFIFIWFSIPLSEPLIGQSSWEVIESPQPLTIMSVLPASVNVRVGQYFTIDVTISDVVDLYGWELRLGWNNTLLEAISVSEGSFLKTGGNTFFAQKTYNSEGYILLDCTLLGAVPGVSGEGTLATVTFLAENMGECPLDLYGTILLSSSESHIVHVTTDGYVTSSRAIPSSNSGCGANRRPDLHT